MSKFGTYSWRMIVFLYSIAILSLLVILSLDFFESEFQDNTSVGDIYIGGMPKEDTSSFILSKTVSYLDELKVEITYNNNTYPIDIGFIEYNHNQTLLNIVEGSNTELVANFSQAKLKLELEKVLPLGMTKEVNTEKMLIDIRNSFENMEPILNIYIKDYIEEMENLYVPINSYIYLTDKNDAVLTDIIDLDIVIESNSRFSLLESFQERNVSSEHLNILATGINAITIDTNFISYEKHNSRIMYLDVDNHIENYETYVNRSQGRDFSFYNPYDLEYEIEVKQHSSGLEFVLWGIPFEEVYGHYVFEKEIDFIPLPDGYEPEEGSNHVFGVTGKQIQVYRYIFNNGVSTYETLIYTNYFSPKNESYEK
ncbi:hypothetical protein KHQ82_08165 [Mycoplasmatota bacterium]|nr:hypothetical protein KHQ82_08165 [Mycoplasmatota bacterium]